MHLGKRQSGTVGCTSWEVKQVSAVGPGQDGDPLPRFFAMTGQDAGTAAVCDCVCRWGDAGQTDETLSTCRFAQRMARITCEVTPNVNQDGGVLVKQLQRCGDSCGDLKVQ